MSAAETATPAAATAAPRRLSGGMLALLAGLAALGTLSTNIILPAFPSMAAALDVPARDLGLTLTSFFLAFAVGQLVVGPASDRFGRRPLVLGGLMLFVIGSAICWAAPDFGTLITGRVVQAAGVCAASVLSRAIARDLYDGEALARALALTMVAMAAAPGFSPLLGSALDTAFGWRAAFVLVGVAGILLAIAHLTVVGETHPADRRRPAGIGGIARAYVELARDRRFILPASAVSLVLGGLYAFFGATPAILMTGMGFTSLELGLFFAATVFVVFGAGFAAPRLAHAFGAGRVARAGTLLALAGGVALAAGGSTPGIAIFTAALSVFLFGMGLVNPLGTAITLQPFGSRAGLASALLGFLQMAMAALATLLVTALPLPQTLAMAVVLTGASGLAALAFTIQGNK
ncbi:multidrug effflux MFS transporter [Tistrella mobilis]|uniref:multidrug effflux MFS transporter n=1 Tax=Tistrella mobilis TaxID=171437 RepID=UPI0035580B3D